MKNLWCFIWPTGLMENELIQFNLLSVRRWIRKACTKGLTSASSRDFSTWVIYLIFSKSHHYSKRVKEVPEEILCGITFWKTTFVHMAPAQVEETPSKTVQELPKNYIYKGGDAGTLGTSPSYIDIPTIDFSLLSSPTSGKQELEKLCSALTSWGCVQVSFLFFFLLLN